MSNVKKERFFGLMILVSMVTLLTLPCLADDSKKPILYDPRKQDSNNEAIFLMDDHGEAMPKHRILKPGQEHSKGFLCLCPNRMGNVPQAHECRRPHEHFANYDLKTVKWFKRVNNELHIEEAKKVCGEDASHRLFQSAIQMGRTYAEIGPDYSNGLESLYLHGFPFFECGAAFLDESKESATSFHCVCRTANHAKDEAGSGEVLSWFVDALDWHEATLTCQEESPSCHASPLFMRQFF